jgi:hypothetical protein
MHWFKPDGLHWLNSDGVHNLMNRLKGQLFHSTFLNYFTLGLNCSHPVLFALSIHWSSPIEADEKDGQSLQIELWHAMRYDLAFKAFDAGWTVSRSDQFIELNSPDEIEKCILNEYGLLMRPKADPRIFELRLAGCTPWLPLSVVEVSTYMQRAGTLSMERTQRPQSFVINCFWGGNVFMRGHPTHHTIRAQKLTALSYEEELKETLDMFWTCCQVCVPAADELPPFRDATITEWGEDRRERAETEIAMSVRGNPIPIYTICSYCRTLFHDLLCCSKCKVTKYCDKICQNQHWSQHKKECQELNTRRLWDLERERIRGAYHRL